ncbi:hypothetical protein [Massilia sp. Leaf139]|uniref:hypothetical protein n=1 Tax=Massilia sp. Leaf139 TaxID=1736272 RepID=UPI000B0574E5|nr:hypothetical protein [Massilia sp. Leaf139]
MIRRAGAALLFVLAFLILVGEIQRYEARADTDLAESWALEYRITNHHQGSEK